jgi:hypothetical protein
MDKIIYLKKFHFGTGQVEHLEIGRWLGESVPEHLGAKRGQSIAAQVKGLQLGQAGKGHFADMA